MSGYRRLFLAQAKASKVYNAHLKNLEATAEVCILDKSYIQLNNVQLKALIATLKRKGDPVMPSRKLDLVSLLESWEDRKEVVIKVPSFDAS